jgi:hypothetical protein
MEEKFMDKRLVEFGKYKNQSVEVMIEDTQYCEWLFSQNGAREQHAWIYQAMQNILRSEDTPEHNTLQMKFMDLDYRTKLGNYVYNLNRDQNKTMYETIYTTFDNNEHVKIEILENLSKDIIRILLQEFTLVMPFFNVYGNLKDKQYSDASFNKIKEKYYDEHTLEKFSKYFKEHDNVSRFNKSDEYDKKEKALEAIIDIIKEDIQSKLKPLLSYKKVEEVLEYDFFFLLDGTIIRNECNIEQDQYRQLSIYTNKITTYEYSKDFISNLIMQIDDNNNYKSSAEPIFEKDNIDVIYNFYPSKKALDYNIGYPLKIELKPVISEDYMSVLRKAIKDKVNVVFCEKIDTTSATIDNIKKAYKKHSIDLVTANDLEIISLHTCESSLVADLITKIDTISIDGKCETEQVKRILTQYIR